MDQFLPAGAEEVRSSEAVTNTREIRVALLEESPSVRSQNILCELAERFAVTYVTGAREIPPARYARVIQLSPARFVLQRSWEISRIADDLYKRGDIDFAVSWERIGLFTRHVPVLLAIGGSYVHEVGVILRSYPWSKRWRALTGFLHYAVPEIISAQRAWMMTVPSATMKKRISRKCKVPIETIRLVPEGVGDLFFDSYDDRKFTAAPQIAFVGRIHPGKGILAFAREFINSQINAPLLIAGDGPDFPALAQLASRDSRVQLRGHITPQKVAALLKETSVFVWPSLYEGCPIAVLEAMASGHACVAYPEGSSAEVLGDAAVYAKYNNPAALCLQLEAVLRDRDRVRVLAQRARQRAREYHWRNCLAETEKLYVDFYCSLRRSSADGLSTPAYTTGVFGR